jgi:hypothetical protein
MCLSGCFFWDSDFSLLYFAQSCSELDLRVLLCAFFLRLVSFLIVVFAQGFVKVALDCLDGRFLLMILSILCFSWFQMFSIFFCKSCLCLRMLELKVLVSIFMLTMSTFFHKYIVLLIGFCRVHNILLSVITMSWSDRPGSGLYLLTNDGLLVINRSRVLFFSSWKIYDLF